MVNQYEQAMVMNIACRKYFSVSENSYVAMFVFNCYNRADRETMMARAGGAGPNAPSGQQYNYDDGEAGLVYNEGR